MNTNLKKSKNRGFTLEETLVAIGILSLSIVATFSAVQNGIQSSTIAKDQITAFYLAQEGMEFIKNIRDENALHTISGVPTNWLASISSTSADPCWFGGGGVNQKTCTIDSPLKVVSSCSGGFGSCPNLNENVSSGLFGYTSTWPPTNFKREIQLTQITSDEVSVNILISWFDRGTTKSFQISEALFNHQ